MNIIVSLSLFPLDPGFRNCPEDIILWKRNPEASRKQPIERLPAHSTGNSCSFERVWKVRTDSPARCRQRRSSPRPEQFVLLCSVDRGRILLIRGHACAHKSVSLQLPVFLLVRISVCLLRCVGRILSSLAAVACSRAAAGVRSLAERRWEKHGAVQLPSFLQPRRPCSFI